MIVKPAEVFQLKAPTVIEVGGQADLALFDLETAHTITAEEFVSKGVNTPFIGATIYGQTVATIVDGQVVYEA
jgi:dihydroorotase